MAGTKEGGLRAAAKNKAKDPDFYRKIGSVGGKRGDHTSRGFAAGEAGRERARIYGAVGGRVSRRGKAKKTDD